MAKSLYGIIGWPLITTFSPDYFKEKFANEGIDATYTAFPIQNIEGFPDLLEQSPDLNGLNVTIPHKTAVMAYLHNLSDDARELGAVNCISIKEGKLTGYNTDWRAFRDSLKPLLQPHHKKALILGGGGAAKAVAYTLQQLNIPFRLVSRAHDSNAITYKDVTHDLLQDHLLIINTTPLGMAPDEDSAPELSYESLTPRHLLYDLIYTPEQTKFLRLGAAQGAVTKNGSEMLKLQAEASWDIWNP